MEINICKYKFLTFTHKKKERKKKVIPLDLSLLDELELLESLESLSDDAGVGIDVVTSAAAGVGLLAIDNSESLHTSAAEVETAEDGS